MIFGIKTSECDKMRIINTINKLGKTSEDFEFYQAEFDDEKQKIIVRKKYFFGN